MRILDLCYQLQPVSTNLRHVGLSRPCVKSLAACFSARAQWIGWRAGGTTQTLVSLLVTVWRRGERLRHE